MPIPRRKIDLAYGHGRHGFWEWFKMSLGLGLGRLIPQACASLMACFFMVMVLLALAGGMLGLYFLAEPHLPK